MSGITGFYSSLRIYSATPAEFPEIVKTLSEWEQQAKDYMKAHEDESYKEEEIDLLLQADAVQSVAPDIRKTIHLMQRSLFQASVEQIVLCRGKDDCLEGVMNTSLSGTDILFLRYLCVNPKNIGLTSPASRQRGVGTALVQHAKDFCLERSCTEILCTTLEGAEAFYRKMGFEGNGHRMKISADAIREERRKASEAVA